jgi:hypothetical protein
MRQHLGGALVAKSPMRWEDGQFVLSDKKAVAG